MNAWKCGCRKQGSEKRSDLHIMDQEHGVVVVMGVNVVWVNVRIVVSAGDYLLPASS